MPSASPRFRRERVARSAGISVPALCVLALAACSPAPIDTDDSGSIAMVEEFFAHLEAGEATEAAAMTSIDFPEETIDDDFYRASAALPSDAQIVDVSGYDDIGATVSVEFDLGDASVAMDVRVSGGDDDPKISLSGQNVTLGGDLASGTLTINGRLEYAVAEPMFSLELLPAVYTGEYSDPLGITGLLGQESTFTAQIPAAVRDGVTREPRLDASTTLLPDVEEGVEGAIEALQAACAAESFAGPSCPRDLVEELGAPRDPSDTGEWFANEGLQIFFDDGAYRATAEYTVRFWEDGSVRLVTATFAGPITRDAAGAIVFTME